MSETSKRGDPQWFFPRGHRFHTLDYTVESCTCAFFSSAEAGCQGLWSCLRRFYCSWQLTLVSRWRLLLGTVTRRSTLLPARFVIASCMLVQGSISHLNADCAGAQGADDVVRRQARVGGPHRAHHAPGLVRGRNFLASHHLAPATASQRNLHLPAVLMAGMLHPHGTVTAACTPSASRGHHCQAVCQASALMAYTASSGRRVPAGRGMHPRWTTWTCTSGP